MIASLPQASGSGRTIEKFFGASSIRRVALIAHNTIREAARQRLLPFSALIAMALVVGARWLRVFDFGGSELKYISDFGFGAMAFFGTALTIAVSGQLLHNEFEHRTVLTLLAKPVHRWEFVLGKWMGLAAIAAGFCAIIAMALGLTLRWAEWSLISPGSEGDRARETINYGGLLVATYGQWLKLTVLAGFMVFIASFSRTQLFTTGIGFVIFVAAQLQFITRHAAQHTSAGFGQSLAQCLTLVVPDFQAFDLGEGATSATTIDSMKLVMLTCYGGGYALSAVSLAAFMFCRRDL
jgi:ABC-2 type transport system permease protein